MTTKIAAALALVALLAGCQKREADTGALAKDSAGIDTVVQSGTVNDTTMVKSDTSIEADTLKKTDSIEKKN